MFMIPKRIRSCRENARSKPTPGNDTSHHCRRRLTSSSSMRSGFCRLRPGRSTGPSAFFVARSWWGRASIRLFPLPRRGAESVNARATILHVLSNRQVTISFIVPAHNEQAGLGRTLQAIHDSARAVGRPYEIIVVNDASTDATPQVAQQHQATVVPVNHRQIAATRNSGGRAARGERFFFVDADTTINPRAVASALRYMDKGAAGGGAAVWVDGNTPLYIRLLTFLGAPIVGK